MKGSVQLGLLCLSLFVLSLHGEKEVETDTSMQMPVNFDEPELHQSETGRVQRHTVSTEKKKAVAPKTKQTLKHPGSLSPLGDIPKTNHRTKRQENRNKKPKRRPGSGSALESLDISPTAGWLAE
ncbi:uncharacterized protein si:ch211-106h4.12 [Puntigrus tetrazona]|uniref:uncharacterized protein si:ch211-106h4.12 n=1 Tax=Puntigrus tetrazona TaxID=1606681 RepID=UPI001C88EBBF|nr:uncharacterized protein si:ch211-106h4.12 [Puntigrus tetrazona]XP_043112695.1 uncharacterized protein si:ch211-106h4.12 [Puntigrus tetrazona]